MAMIALPARHAAAASLAALLALSACAGPGPVTAPTTGTYIAPPPSASATQPAGPGEYIAAPGDTVFTVAQRNGVGVRALIEENKLQPPYALQPGQRLRLPPQREHVVQSGETVYAIARRYQVPMAELVRINNIAPPYAIRAGQKLRLPDPVGEIETAAVPAAPTPPSVAQSAVQVVELPPPPNGPKPGTPYAAPPAQQAPTASQLAAPPPVAKPAGKPDSSMAPTPLTLGGNPQVAVGQTPPPGVVPSSPPPAPVAPPPVTPAPAAPAPTESAAVIVPPTPNPPAQGFVWPVRGELISRFGDKGPGLRNEGINIAAARGTPVVAADSGVVVYSGNELKGFGNLILIRHANGWVTAYAHNDTLLVARGDQVERGQEIARVGSTGNVSSPQLHFEVRKGSERIDPLTVIGGEGDPRKT